MQQETPLQRLRLVFTRGDEIKYISHLDIMRMWERILRRGEVPLAYSHWFNPQPRMALAAPLPVGVTSEGELMDVFTSRRISVREFQRKVEPQLPVGVQLRQVEEVPLAEPSLQSRLRFADYQTQVRTNLSREQAEQRVRQLLEAAEIVWERRRGKEIRRYNLRPLVESLWVKDWNEEQSLQMRLQHSPRGTARPEQVLAALGLEKNVVRIHRLRLHFEGE